VSTIPSKVVYQYLNEDIDYSFAYKLDTDITNSTVSFVAIPTTATTTTGTLLGVSAGASANVEQTIALDTSVLATGEYYLEIYKNKDTSSVALLYPTENVIHKLIVQSRYGA
jgi:hypothetical protein